MIRTTIMADAELLARIERLARMKGQSKAQVIREAMAHYLVEAEGQLSATNPLLSLIGLAGDEAVAMDLSDGQDEEILTVEWTE